MMLCKNMPNAPKIANAFFLASFNSQAFRNHLPFASNGIEIGDLELNSWSAFMLEVAVLQTDL